MRVRDDKIEMRVYLTPEAFRAFEDSRNVNMPRSTFASMCLEEIFNPMED